MINCDRIFSPTYDFGSKLLVDPYAKHQRVKPHTDSSLVGDANLRSIANGAQWISSEKTMNFHRKSPNDLQGNITRIKMSGIFPFLLTLAAVLVIWCSTACHPHFHHFPLVKSASYWAIWAPRSERRAPRRSPLCRGWSLKTMYNVRPPR